MVAARAGARRELGRVVAVGDDDVELAVVEAVAAGEVRLPRPALEDPERREDARVADARLDDVEAHVGERHRDRLVRLAHRQAEDVALHGPLADLGGGPAVERAARSSRLMS